MTHVPKEQNPLLEFCHNHIFSHFHLSSSKPNLFSPECRDRLALMINSSQFCDFLPSTREVLTGSDLLGTAKAALGSSAKLSIHSKAHRKINTGTSHS